MQNKSNFNNQEYILEVIKYWTPQKMFKYVQSYDKKPEQKDLNSINSFFMIKNS